MRNRKIKLPLGVITRDDDLGPLLPGDVLVAEGKEIGFVTNGVTECGIVKILCATALTYQGDKALFEQLQRRTQ